METRHTNIDEKSRAENAKGRDSSENKSTKKKKHRVKHAFSRVFHAYRQRWFQVLATGIVFIALMEISYLVYPNANLIPAMIVYAAFLVPITLMVHLYEKLYATELPLAVIMISFICAGAIGVTFASSIETAFFPSFGFFEYLAVGPVEETAKMIVPAALFALGSYRSVGTGVMIGLVSAMAFSSLETSGYIFNAFLGTSTGGGSDAVASLFKNPFNIARLDLTAVARSLMDPIGHGTWTMLVCFALFNEARKAGRFVLNGNVVLAFVLAMLLHSSWDTTLSVPSSPVWGRVLATVGFFVIFIFTVWLMKRIIWKTREVMEETSGTSTSAQPKSTLSTP